MPALLPDTSDYHIRRMTFCQQEKRSVRGLVLVAGVIPRPEIFGGLGVSPLCGDAIPKTSPSDSVYTADSRTLADSAGTAFVVPGLPRAFPQYSQSARRGGAGFEKRDTRTRICWYATNALCSLPQRIYP
jgi:hypothetical protein